MNAQLWTYFERMPAALPLYEAFEARVLSAYAPVTVKVQKTQISFSNKHQFACAWLPHHIPKKAAAPFLMITFGLPYRVDSPRIEQSTEPYPNRWTHHVRIERTEDIDGELLEWIDEAYHFAAFKRRGH